MLRRFTAATAGQGIADQAAITRISHQYKLFSDPEAGTPHDQRAGAGREAPATVAMCGDDPAALRTVGQLVRDVGGVPAVLGSLDRARQLEEVAGFVIGLAFAGADPRFAVPSVR